MWSAYPSKKKIDVVVYPALDNDFFAWLEFHQGPVGRKRFRNIVATSNEFLPLERCYQLRAIVAFKSFLHSRYPSSEPALSIE